MLGKLLALSVSILLLAGCGTRPGQPSPAVSGTRAWLMVFSGPVTLQTPIEITSSASSRSVRARFLENTPFTFDEGVRRGDQVRLRARTPRGAMRISLNLGAEQATGEWHADHWIGRYLFKGKVHAVPIPATALASLARAEVADTVLAMVRRSFFDPALNGLDASVLAAELRASVGGAPTSGDAATAINAMLRRLGSSHAALGPVIPLETRAALAEIGPARAGTQPHANPVSWRKIADGVGYLKLSSFPGGAASIPASAALDSAFAEMNTLPALVIDLRGNPGGHLEVAARLASHLSSRTFDVGVFVSQNGLRRYSATTARDLDFAKLPRLAARSVNSESFFPRLEELHGAAMLTAGGGDVPRYCGRVVVLIDAGSGSTAEVVAGGIQSARLGTLVGTRTAGALLASAPFTPARGWVLRLPVYDYRTAGGARVEGAGIAPDVLVQPRRGRDAQLARALSLVQEIAPGTSSSGSSCN